MKYLAVRGGCAADATHITDVRADTQGRSPPGYTIDEGSAPSSAHSADSVSSQTNQSRSLVDTRIAWGAVYCLHARL
jgi:hypothetical protein